MSTDPTAATRRQQSSSAVSSRTAASAGPRPPCTIHSSAIISDKAIITGTYPVSIGENSVLHPYSKISSAVAPISIGRNCIIAERAAVGLAQESRDDNKQSTVELGDNISVEAGAIVEARLLDDGTIVDVDATAGRGTSTGKVMGLVIQRMITRTDLGKFCKISAACTISHEHLPDYTIIYGRNERRIDTTVQSREDIKALKIKGHLMQIDNLKRLIPSNTAKWQS